MVKYKAETVNRLAKERAVTIENTVKVSKRYQIAVPAEARQRLNIQSGDRLIVDIQDGMLILLPRSLNYTQSMVGLHKEIWEGKDGQEYVTREREAWEDSANS